MSCTSNNSGVCYCGDVSNNSFDLVDTIGQTFGHAGNANGRVKINVQWKLYLYLVPFLRY